MDACGNYDMMVAAFVTKYSLGPACQMVDPALRDETYRIKDVLYKTSDVVHKNCQ
jgi:hypothetical protein